MHLIGTASNFNVESRQYEFTVKLKKLRIENMIVESLHLLL